MWGPDRNTPRSQIFPGDKLNVSALLSAALELLPGNEELQTGHL